MRLVRNENLCSDLFSGVVQKEQLNSPSFYAIFFFFGLRFGEY